MSQTGQGIELLDRSHLNALLREHKLALTGLIDPKTVRRLGQIASAEALLLGTVVPSDDRVIVSIKLLATDTARVILAGNVDVPRTKFVSDLLGKRADEAPMDAEAAGSGSAAVSAQASSPQGGAVSNWSRSHGFRFDALACVNRRQNTECTVLITNTGSSQGLASSDQDDFGTADITTRLIDEEGSQYRYESIVEGLNGQVLPRDTPVKAVIAFPRLRANVSRVNLMLGLMDDKYRNHGFVVVLKRIPVE